MTDHSFLEDEGHTVEEVVNLPESPDEGTIYFRTGDREYFLSAR